MSELKSLSGRIDDEFAVLEKKFKDTQADPARAGRNCFGSCAGNKARVRRPTTILAGSGPNHRCEFPSWRRALGHIVRMALRVRYVGVSVLTARSGFEFARGG
jgi:hypothetical protein